MDIFKKCTDIIITDPERVYPNFVSLSDRLWLSNFKKGFSPKEGATWKIMQLDMNSDDLIYSVKLDSGEDILIWSEWFEHVEPIKIDDSMVYSVIFTWADHKRYTIWMPVLKRTDRILFKFNDKQFEYGITDAEDICCLYSPATVKENIFEYLDFDKYKLILSKHKFTLWLLWYATSVDYILYDCYWTDCKPRNCLELTKIVLDLYIYSLQNMMAKKPILQVNGKVIREEEVKDVVTLEFVPRCATTITDDEWSEEPKLTETDVGEPTTSMDVEDMLKILQTAMDIVNKNWDQDTEKWNDIADMLEKLMWWQSQGQSQQGQSQGQSQQQQEPRSFLIVYIDINWHTQNWKSLPVHSVQEAIEEFFMIINATILNIIW